MNEETPRQLSRNEIHDLSMIVKDRAKVLKAHIDAQSAKVMAEFEREMTAVYHFSQDEVWERAMADATAAIRKASEQIAKRCEELGIPLEFAPGVGLAWHGRGQNAVKDRQSELRRVAKTRVEAMAKDAMLKIEKQSLELRTQIVALGVLSPEAKLFLESLAPVEEAMGALTFSEVQKLASHRPRQMLGYDE